MTTPTLFALLSPYLPPSLLSPLAHLLSLPSTLLADPSQLVPLLISLVTLYAAVMSLWSTTRLAFRAVWFTLKWGAIAAALAATFSSWNGGGGEGGGWVEGFKGAGRVGRAAWGVGRTGVEWWANSQNLGGKEEEEAGGRGKGAQGRAPRKTTGGGAGRGRKSASGSKRTWARASDDGGWDDPDEGDEREQDPIKALQETLMTFLAPAPPPPPPSQAKKGRKPATKGKKVTVERPEERPATDLASLMRNYAWARVSKVWEDLSDAGGAREATGAKARR